MIKLETHCHAGGASPCGDCPVDKVIEYYKKENYGGIVLTNHYTRVIIELWYGAKSDAEGVEKYLSFYDVFKKKGEEAGLKIFFGMEISLKSTLTEYMVYGIDDKQFLYDNPRIDELSQKELFELVNKNGLFMYQTHPFRTGVVAGDPKYLHGAESFNGHFHHVNSNDMANRFCEENGLIKLSGSDMHHEGQPVTGGIYIPENINTNQELVSFIKKNDFNRIEMADRYFDGLYKFRTGK